MDKVYPPYMSTSSHALFAILSLLYIRSLLYLSMYYLPGTFYS